MLHVLQVLHVCAAYATRVCMFHIRMQLRRYRARVLRVYVYVCVRVCSISACSLEGTSRLLRVYVYVC